MEEDMADLLAGGTTKKEKQTFELSPFAGSLQGLLAKLLLTHMFQNGGRPQTFGDWLQQGPRAMPQVPLTKDESRYSQFGAAQLPGPQGFQTPSGVNPLLGMFLGGNRNG
jgi:hypothetical protein